ncbi:60S ribosomal protein L6 [Trypanosoma brucei equiperdum]|nr:60S ribosomal protein L6 [Trypanosoma brucei equiperdum]
MKYSGVPIRRIDSRYIIATSTRVDLTGVDTSAITPEIFKREKKEKRVKSEGEFMGDKDKKKAESKAKKTSKAAPKGTVSDERAQLQNAIDTALIQAIKKDPLGKEMAGYLHSVFTIKPGDAPHRLKW